MTVSRKLMMQGVALGMMALVALATPKRALASTTQCNYYCWYDCSPYGVSGCSSGNAACTTWVCSNTSLGDCASVGLVSIACYQNAS
jgi:hypothetical protein